MAKATAAPGMSIESKQQRQHGRRSASMVDREPLEDVPSSAQELENRFRRRCAPFSAPTLDADGLPFSFGEGQAWVSATGIWGMSEDATMPVGTPPEQDMARSSLWPSRRQVLAALGAAGLLGAGYAATAFSGALAEAERRVSGRSALIRTPFGNLEYAAAGRGPALMMIHGTGGGFDQGLRFSAGLIQHGLRVIAPSRFGYLRSDFPPDPSSENQADALIHLLDRLEVDRLPVAGGSAGALAAVQLALRHPDRLSGLILLVPAANVRGRDPVEMGPLQKFMVERLLTSDLLFWAALNTIPDRLIGTLLATDPRLLREVSPAERRRAYTILEDLMPVGARSRGMLNDARLAGSPARVDFGRIRVPTLVVSVEDDRFGTAATARDIAASVPRARLVIYPSGGHVWLGYDDAVAEGVARFVSELATT